MSSKNAEAQATREAAGQPPRVWSITGRFTVLYVASTAALLLLAVGFLYLALERNLHARDDALLTSKVQVLRLLLREQPDKTQALASEVEHEAAESPLRYYLRILDDQGRVLIETPGMKDLLPVALFPAPAPVSAESPVSLDEFSRAHQSFLLLAVQATAGAGGREPRFLHVALDVSTDLALLADYRRRLVIVLGLGLLFATYVGGWLARQGIRPLVEITQSARQITASQLRERILVSRWPAELAELAAAFNAMLDRLEDSFTRLSQFSADLAHELRTPINNLRGEAEVALARSRSPEDYQRTLASSLEECDRLSRMIDGLLFLARTDDPKAAVERVRFDARKEVEAVREFYEALAGEQGVAVACEGEAALMGDPALFRRAVSNLLGNALRHTPVHGTVRLALRPLEDQSVELTVRDTGSGIAPEHLQRVFDRFYRADRSRSQAPGGTGLGLAIVQSIMRLHGGTADAQSQPGQGTTITLKFPSHAATLAADKITKM